MGPALDLGATGVTTAALICLVIAIADGDTLTARCGPPDAAHQVVFRVAAIDAPERAQPHGKASRRALAAMCFRVRAQFHSHGPDRYGRTVADVKCGRHDVATEQVRAGMAWVYDKYAKGYERLYQVQDAARARRAGLWTDAEPLPPWEWRRAK